MNRLLASVVIGLAAFQMVHPAFAQSTAPAAASAKQNFPDPAKVDPAKLELAKQLIKLNGSSREFDVILPNIADQAKTTFIRANPQMQLGIIDVVDKIALSMVDRRAELDDRLAAVWAQSFDQDELQKLVDFYQSPLGKKFSDAQPNVIGTQVRVAQLWAQQISEDMTKQIAAQLKTAVASEAKQLEGAQPSFAPDADTDASASAPVEAPAAKPARKPAAKPAK
ncbi:hypothetical protein SAMN05216548_11911 [Faunimonas pinastri]|uniref:DUF2059 domain-containing protein n=1 Tax=Faunimonas pinastri TaxID=1855383 RepID=A0A1H9PAY3_9HYPH|nr:DUF2059 domain-containing protein [Faunimonas pinastri]SER44763.1 hypothetical protein SAMN05216548_11911 [Faunimonas pinastri]